LADVLAKPGVDRSGIAPAHHQIDASVSNYLEHRVIFSDLDRIISGDQRGSGGEQEPLRLGRDISEHGGRGGRHKRRIMVLAGGKHVQSNFFGLLCNLKDRTDALSFGGRAARCWVRRHITDAEDSELHGYTVRGLEVPFVEA